MVDAAGDYDYTNTASVTDDGGSNPTISDKAHPIIVSEGTGTGTGDCQFPSDAWNNVSDNTDIGVFDANDNALTFEIESLDTTNNTAVIWVYKSSLPRDNTDDVKVALGSGSTDDSDTTGTWGNTGQNAQMVQHLQDDPLTATDSTGNNNDGTVNGATATTGEFDGAGSFDGTDDYIGHSLDIDSYSELSVVSWFKSTQTGTANGDGWSTVSWGEDSSYGEISLYINDGNRYTEGKVAWRVTDGSDSVEAVSSNTLNDGSFHQLVATYKANDNIYLNVDGSLDDSAGIGTKGNPSSTMHIGEWVRTDDFLDAIIDAVRIYSDSKSSDWVQADYDASPKAGQTLFSWNGAESTTTVVSATVSDNLNLSENTTAALAIDITGQVTLDGSGVSGANVYAYDETNEVFLSQDETDASGNYTIPNAPEGNEILIAVDYDSGTTRYGEEESIIAG